MKLGKHEFARLIAHIQRYLSEDKSTLTSYDIEDIDNLIDFDAPVNAVYPTANDVAMLMHLMHEGTRKIEAIKCHRKLTGMGLKESKDAVAKYWISKGHYDPNEVKLATLETLKNKFATKPIAPFGNSNVDDESYNN
jgi:ribosomal protein L7/L12